MHPKFGGNSMPQNFAGFIKTPFYFWKQLRHLSISPRSMQLNSKHIISFKVASYSACYLTNDDCISYLREKLTHGNKVIAAVKKSKSQVFDLCESVQICRIFADFCRYVQICRLCADLCRYVQTRKNWHTQKHNKNPTALSNE